MTMQLITVPPMPEIGLAESQYGQLVRAAEREGDTLARDAAKVGQYITLAGEPSLHWEDKLRYLRHTLFRHCVPPKFADDTIWMFYKDLANLVRIHAGAQALRTASREDDHYALQLQLGEPRSSVEDQADLFFATLVPHRCPVWLNQEDYEQLTLIRDHWI